jgi:hypothetical protein
MSGWGVSHVSHVRNFVSDFDQLCLWRQKWGILNLEPFALCFRQALVVGDLFNQTPDFGAKTSFQFFSGGLGVFDRVVKNGSLKRGEIGDTAYTTENFRHFDGMINVRACFAALAALVAVFVGGKVQGSEESSQIGISFRDGIQRLPLKKV